MRKIFLLFSVILLAGMVSAQKNSKIEVLYFKANLACCKARACNALQNEVQNIIYKNFTDGSVIFREIKLSDTANRKLVEKYQAKSQTVIIVKKKKKNEVSEDVSAIVAAYLQNQNKETLENELLAKISELKKK